MKQASTKFSKAMIGLIVSLAAKGHAQTSGKFISQEILEKHQISTQAIQELLLENILRTTKTAGWFEFNDQQAQSVLQSNQDEEMKSFVTLLQKLVADQTEVCSVDPACMTISTQDFDPTKD